MHFFYTEHFDDNLKLHTTIKALLHKREAGPAVLSNLGVQIRHIYLTCLCYN